MAPRLRRKIADTTDPEALEEIQSYLSEHQIRSVFEIRDRRGHDTFWIFVEIAFAPAARQLMAERREQIVADNAALFAKGREILKEATN